MIRRFNSLIKGPKGQISDEELSELHVSLRPALSVDSSFASSQQHHVNPLQQQIARAHVEGLALARRSSENAQTSWNESFQEREERGRANGFVIGRVPEERSLKEGYEHGNHLHSSVDSPRQYESGEKPSDPREQSNLERVGENYQSGENGALSAQPQFTFRPVPAQADVPRVLRTSSDAVVAADRNPQSDLHSFVDIPDAQAGSGVDLESVRRSILTAGPGRTISSWSTDSAAEHCRICQQHSEEPLIELGCLCRGEMSKSHKSCIEMWFKNKGTNKCEVCQHVASNIPAPETSPAPHFWVWRLGGAYAAGQAQTVGQAGVRRVGLQSVPIVNRPVLLMLIRKYPLIPIMWLGLLSFMTYLFVDAINTSTVGYAAMPIGFLFGVLVVLGLGTAVRLVLEYLHERNVRRSIRLMELLESPANQDSAAGADRPTAQNGPSSV